MTVGKESAGRRRRFRCLLFDLDGTLVDSRADLVASVNLTLAEAGRAPLAGELVAGFVGEGVSKLIERSLAASLGRAPSAAEVGAGVETFRRHYRLHLLDHTRPYPGVPETLSRLAALPMAVVTNKPADFSLEILERLGLGRHFRAVLGGDSLPQRKPHPAPLLEAARLCGGARPAECLMIGDSRVDVAAGKAAGMWTCGFTGGFRGRRELEEAGADLLFGHFRELSRLVET
jgi:phosphoglycolate phosphatase